MPLGYVASIFNTGEASGFLGYPPPVRNDGHLQSLAQSSDLEMGTPGSHDWCAHDWSGRVAVQDAALPKETNGLYRIRVPDQSMLLYLGQGNERERLELLNDLTAAHVLLSEHPSRLQFAEGETEPKNVVGPINDLYRRKGVQCMNSGEGPYQVKCMRLTQDDIWMDRDGRPWLTIRGESEDLFVIGKVVRNNEEGVETFVPDRVDGKIMGADRSKRYACHVCYNANASAFHSIWQRLSHENPDSTSLLISASLHYFAPGLEYATEQVLRDGYDQALADLILAAPRHETWYVGFSVACLNEENNVLINEPRTPLEAPPLITLPFTDLAKLAFPDPSLTKHREEGAQ